MKQRHYCIVLTIFAVLLFFVGCQPAPKENVVISKNDGAFDVSAVQSETRTHGDGETFDISYSNVFYSTDGSVNYYIDIDQTQSSYDMPIVKVSPYYLTNLDAKRVATAFFPDAVFYEAEPELKQHYSKSEIQEKIYRWSKYTNENALEDLYGEPIGDSYPEIVKKFVNAYTVKLETAPSENPHEPCRWEMRKDSVYYLTGEELRDADMSGDSDAISTQFTVDGIPYCFTATTRNKNDYKVNTLSCYIYDGICPRNLDERIFAANLCRTEAPTKDQVDKIRAGTEQLLEMFDLGQWKINECHVNTENYGDHLEYMVYINAVPVFNDVSAIKCEQITALRNQEGYAPNHYLTDAEFFYSPNGELISFSLFTPLTVQEIVNANVKVLDMQDLLSRAEKHLQHTDAYNFYFGQYIRYFNEKLQCNVHVSELEYGLTRIRIKDTEDAYYYVPAITLKGIVEYIGEETNQTFYISEKPEILVTINAVDGTVINSTNE